MNEEIMIEKVYCRLRLSDNFYQWLKFTSSQKDLVNTSARRFKRLEVPSTHIKQTEDVTVKGTLSHIKLLFKQV